MRYVTTSQHIVRTIFATINLSSLVLTPSLIKLPLEYMSRDMTWVKIMGRQMTSSSIKWCRQPVMITKPFTLYVVIYMCLYSWRISTKHWTLPVNYLWCQHVLRLGSITNSCRIHCPYIILRTVRRCLNHGSLLLLLLTMLWTLQ